MRTKVHLWKRGVRKQDWAQGTAGLFLCPDKGSDSPTESSEAEVGLQSCPERQYRH